LTEQASGADASIAFLVPALVANPDAVELHRLYQAAAISLGKRQELIAKYRKMHDEKPDSPDRGYLLARLLAPAAAAPVLEDLVRRFPNHLQSRRGHAFNEYELGHFEAALASYRLLTKLDFQEGQRQLEFAARALVALGRAEEALHEIE